MRLFSCPGCGLIVFFSNTRCERCAATLGYEPATNRMIVVTEDGPWRYCGNRPHAVCNWVLPATSSDELCRACRHNEVIPDLSRDGNLALWRKMESAKHRLLYTILRLQLPLLDRVEDPEGLGFQFLAADDPKTLVMTGHAGGLITIALAEADDPEREKRRTKLREPYRTLLGHFRHEVGHWYWDRLVRDTPWHARFTTLFGDASQDYGEALQRHYANGPRPNWQEELISAYASSHPWEDFAETWAHYFHMIDTLETGGSFGIVITPQLESADVEVLSTALTFDVNAPGLDVETLFAAWVALAAALNSFNRSMGLPDAYPFTLSAKVREKLAFVHELIQSRRPS